MPLALTASNPLSNVRDWLAAGAIAVGAGADLCPPAAVEAEDAEALRGQAERYVTALAAARAPDRGLVG